MNLRNEYLFKVLNYGNEIKVEVSYLTRIQRWICKLFKISPEKLFYYTYDVTIISNGKILPSNVLRDIQGNLWYVNRAEFYKNGIEPIQRLVVKSTKPIHGYVKGINGELLLLYSQFKEGN